MRSVYQEVFICLAASVALIFLCLALPLQAPWLSLAIAAASILPFTWNMVRISKKLSLQIRQNELRVANMVVDSQSLLQAVLNIVPIPIYIKDAESKVLVVNAAYVREWATTEERLIGQSSIDLAPSPEIGAMMRAEDIAVLDGKSIYKEEENFHPVTGIGRFRVITKGMCQNADGKPMIVCTQFDSTQWRIAERDLKHVLEREVTLRESTQNFIQRLIDVIPDPFYIKDAKSRFLMVNEALVSQLAQSKEALIGAAPHALSLTSATAKEATAEDMAVIAGAVVENEEHSTHPITGEELFRQVVKRRCEYIDGSTVIVGAHFNITRWKIAERELQRLAHEDPLTGMGNRRCFYAFAERAISRASRYNEALSLFIFDIDHFKNINDQYGHQAGDEVLQEIARRTALCLRASDFSGRWGGEEFVVLLPMANGADALLISNRLGDLICNTPFATCGGALSITASFGATQFIPGESFEQLIARADVGLHHAKDKGRNRSVLQEFITT